MSEIEPALPEPISAARLSGAASGAVPENAYGVTDTTRPWIFAAALASMFMAAIEGTIVATAMPSIVGSLGGFDLFSWVFTAYLLTQAVMIPIYGRLADIYGRKRILLIGITLFLGGSVLCGFAWSMVSLIAFRVVQGIGSGAVMPVAQTLLGDLYQGEARARVQGYVSSTFGSAGVFGPIVGAFIVSHASWSVVFWVNVPLGIVASLLLAFALREHVQSRRHHIDYVGSALMTLGIGSLMFVLVQAQNLSTAAIAGLSVVAALSLAILVAWELNIPEPMLPIKLWRNRVVVGSNIVNLASGAVAMGITAFLPAYMQAVMGCSIFVAGIALTASAVGWPTGGFVAGRLMLRSTYRKAAMAGASIAVIGALLMAALDPGRGAAWAIAGACLTGLGLGMANNCFIVAIQASVGWTERGVATSSFVFMRIVGQTVGTAVFGGILNAGLSGHLAGGGDLVTRILEPTLRQTIPEAQIAPVMAAFAAALHNVYVINGVLVVVVLTATVALPMGMRLVARRSPSPAR